MSEINALVRVSLARHRWLLLAMVASVVIGVVIALISTAWSVGETGSLVASIALFLSLMPAGIASIVLFDYGLDQDLSLPDSGCSHWILRMPIRAWKIAMVPVVLKSLWVSTLWILFVLAARVIGTSRIPLIMPCVVFSAITVWIMVLSWRPFRSSFRRVAALLIAVPVFYCEMVGAFAAPTIEQVSWRTIATVASVVGGTALYVVGVWCLIGSTELARISPDGFIPAARWGRDGRSRPDVGAASEPSAKLVAARPIRHLRSPAHAILQHDFQKSYDWIRKLYLLLVIPATIILTLFVPVNAFGVILSLVLFVYFAGFASSRTFASGNASAALPVYLAASPLSTKTLAWTRQLFPLVAALGTYLCILFVIAGWACWASNRQTWMSWAEAQSAAIGGEIAPLQVGIRLSIAIVLGVGVLFLGRLAAFAWVGMTGRSWVNLAVTVIASLAFLVLFGIGLRWFMRQTDWETTQASMFRVLATLPWLVGGLLVVKAVVAILVGFASRRQQVVNVGDLIRATALWSMLTVVVAVAFHLLIPYSFATFGWCLALTALAIPFARVLALPLAVSFDRHR